MRCFTRILLFIITLNPLVSNENQEFNSDEISHVPVQAQEGLRRDARLLARHCNRFTKRFPTRPIKISWLDIVRSIRIIEDYRRGKIYNQSVPDIESFAEIPFFDGEDFVLAEKQGIYFDFKVSSTIPGQPPILFSVKPSKTYLHKALNIFLLEFKKGLIDRASVAINPGLDNFLYKQNQRPLPACDTELANEVHPLDHLDRLAICFAISDEPGNRSLENYNQVYSKYLIQYETGELIARGFETVESIQGKGFQQLIHEYSERLKVLSILDLAMRVFEINKDRAKRILVNASMDQLKNPLLRTLEINRIKSILDGTYQSKLSPQIQKIEMVKIEGGKFYRGDQEDFKYKHQVKISNFEISAHEVTLGQIWKISNQLPIQRSRDFVLEYPALASSGQVKKLIQKLNETRCSSGVSCWRLPTAAELEFASLNPEQKDEENFYWSSNKFKEFSPRSLEYLQSLFENSWTRANSAGRLHPVGLLKSNQKGLFDVIGNSKERTSSSLGYNDTWWVSYPKTSVEFLENPRNIKAGRSLPKEWKMTLAKVSKSSSFKTINAPKQLGRHAYERVSLSDTGFRLVRIKPID